MKSILPIPEEPQKEESRLADFYQQMLMEQAHQRAAEPVKAVEHPENQSRENANEEKNAARRDTGPAVRLELRGPAEKAAYSKDDILQHHALASETLTTGALSAEDQELIQRLRQRDTEVRQHEMQHVAALGPYAGAVTFHYQIGPDGRAYAIGGTTEVRAAVASTPEAAVQQARTVRAAALATGEPSRADLAATDSAAEMERKALRRQVTEPKWVGP